MPGNRIVFFSVVIKERVVSARQDMQEVLDLLQGCIPQSTFLYFYIVFLLYSLFSQTVTPVETREAYCIWKQKAAPYDADSGLE